MARYIPHPSIPEKFCCRECDYGLSKGVSRQAVNGHFKRVHSEPEEAQVESPIEPIIEGLSEPPTIEPEWMTVGGDEEGVSELTSLPAPAKGALKFFSQNREVPSGSKSLKAFYAKQGRMLSWFFRGVIDPLMSAYGRGVMGEKGKSFNIKRSKDEWELFEGIATEWVEYREVSIPVNPDMLMIGCVGAFYIPPLKAIQSQRDPDKPSLLGRLKLRIVAWRIRREMKRKGVEHFEAENR